MNKINIIIIITVLFFAACKEKTVHHSQLNLCNKYSLSEYSDSLYSDTLIWETDTSTINWYKIEIKKIIDYVKGNCEDSTHLVFPFQKFDEVIYYNNSYRLFGNKLNDNEIKRLMDIINNPLNFGWGETTFLVDKLIVFEMNGKEIGRLEIMNEGIIKSEPDNLLLKAGALNKLGQEKFNSLIEGL